jgi:hypothetical protein
VWAALIHQHSGIERQMEASAGPESLVQERRDAVVFRPLARMWHGTLGQVRVAKDNKKGPGP